jgi:hypothetical protein
VYAKRYDEDVQTSGPDKMESKKMANGDWNQLGETYKAKSDKEKFVRDASKTYQKAKRSDYVKECRTGVQQKKREWKKAKQQRANRKMPATPPRQEQEAEDRGA